MAHRVGIIGAGYIAEWHARALAGLPGVEMVAVCDLSHKRAAELAGRWRIRGIYSSLEQMLGTERLDVVHVLVPPDHHLAATEMILEAGAHALVEKPMAISAADCRRLLALAEEKGVLVGVGHNFLFADPYERLRRDVKAGRLGRIDHVVITWNRELPHARMGPFDAWMLRAPSNIMLEIGVHSAAHLLDLLGDPEEVEANATHALRLPTGSLFYRQWRILGRSGAAAVDVHFSFGPGYTEHVVHARGSYGTATADLENSTYNLRRHTRHMTDLDRYLTVRRAGGQLYRQALSNFCRDVLWKVRTSAVGTGFGASIARTLAAFYEQLSEGRLDERMSASFAQRAVALAERFSTGASGTTARPPCSATREERPPGLRSGQPRILVLGGSGFIGRELVRQLLAADCGVRMLLRRPGAAVFPSDTPNLEVVAGDLQLPESVRSALQGIETVYHLARAAGLTWEDYYERDVQVTCRLAELCLEQGVRQFVYTGTIDSYFNGEAGAPITEETPLDRHPHRRNPYSRAKTMTEKRLRELHRERGLPLVIFRPGIVIGRGSTPYHGGVGLWDECGGVCQLWGDGRTPLPLVLVEDVAAALVAALGREDIIGESFNLIGEPCLNAHEYLEEIERHIGVELQKYDTAVVKFYLSDVARWLVKVLIRHHDLRRPSYRDWSSRRQANRFDCSKANRLLGWEPERDRARIIARGVHAPLDEMYA